MLPTHRNHIVAILIFTLLLVMGGHFLSAVPTSAQDLNDLLLDAVGTTRPEAGIKRPQLARTPAKETLELLDKLNESIGRRHELIDKAELLDPKKRRYESKDYSDWVEVYTDMRSLLRHDYTADQNFFCANTLRDAVKDRRDFVDGRVLLLLFAIYAGEHREAMQLLPKVREELERYELDQSFLAIDFCYAAVLLRSDEALNTLRWMNQLPNTTRPAAATWLIARAQMLSDDPDGEIEAQRSLVRAISKAENDKIPPKQAAPLYGDAAFFFLTAGMENLRSPSRARKLLDQVGEDGSAQCWQVSRAQAALFAHDGDWEKAAQTLATALNQCPPHLAHEFIRQKSAYEEQREWFMDKK